MWSRGEGGWVGREEGIVVVLAWSMKETGCAQTHSLIVGPTSLLNAMVESLHLASESLMVVGGGHRVGGWSSV